jgi:hypothetical protein
MRKILVLIVAALSVQLFCGEKVKMSDIIDGDMFKKGYSATVKTTSDMPMMPVQKPYTVYTDSDGNSRTETEDNVSLYIEEKGKNMVYNYDKKSKTYTVMSLDDMPGGEMANPDDFDEEELVEKAGSATFAGVKCDRYKVIMEETSGGNDEEEMQGESYIYIDPAKKMMVGMEMKMGPYTMKMEYTNIKYGVDKAMFKPLTGYKKTEGFPMGGFNR